MIKSCTAFQNRNSVLIEWHNIKSQDINYADLLNNIIPEGSIRIKCTSERIEECVRVQCSRVFKQNKQLSLKGSKKRRAEYLNGFSKISILVSDVVSAAEMEVQLQNKEKGIQKMQERLNDLSIELDEWRKRYGSLEEEKKLLFQEMQDKLVRNANNLESRVSSLESENEGMRKYIRELEKESEECPP